MIAVWLWSGCFSPPDAAIAPPPVAPSTSAPTTAPGAPSPAAPATPARTFVWGGWPGEHRPRITATRDLTLEVVGAAGGPVEGTCALAEGAELAWTESLVRTERPGVVAVAAAQPLSAQSRSYGPVDAISAVLGRETAAPAPASVGPGDEVLHLTSLAEGWCLYRIQGDVVSTPCFHERGEAADQSWWVRTSCGQVTGWVRVDGQPTLKAR